MCPVGTAVGDKKPRSHEVHGLGQMLRLSNNPALDAQKTPASNSI
jgi:hypothetical protein